MSHVMTNFFTHKHRGSSIAFLTSLGNAIMVDCGEATQHQVMRSKSVRLGCVAARADFFFNYENCRRSKLDLICLTHLHGDHCFGIFGLLCTMGYLSRMCQQRVLTAPRARMYNRQTPVTVIGPVGVRQMVENTLSLQGARAVVTLSCAQHTAALLRRAALCTQPLFAWAMPKAIKRTRCPSSRSATRPCAPKAGP